LKDEWGESMNNTQVLTKNKRTGNIFLILLMGLLILRFPFLILLDKLPIAKSMCSSIYQDGTYFLIAVLILLKRNSLNDYHIDFTSLMIFTLVPIAKTVITYIVNPFTEWKGMSLSQFYPYWWIQIIISSSLLIALFVFRPKLDRRKVREVLPWLLIAIAIGICIGILGGFILRLQSSVRNPNHPSVPLFIVSFFAQLGNAAAMEEPLFRGFLWGYLKNIRWKDYWIWIFQALLFMLGHIYYLGVYNYSFWIIVPFDALILGFIAWRSRSIGTSMIAHGLFNSLGDLVAHFTW
jgi:membrane protease YdiL (CAAX protease family)